MLLFIGNRSSYVAIRQFKLFHCQSLGFSKLLKHIPHTVINGRFRSLVLLTSPLSSLYLILSCEILRAGGEDWSRGVLDHCQIVTAGAGATNIQHLCLTADIWCLVPEIRYLTSNTSAPCSNTFYCTKNKVTLDLRSTMSSPRTGILSLIRFNS